MPRYRKTETPQWTVYGLIDPRDGHLFYVGITTGVTKRILEHTYNEKSSARGMIMEIMSEGLKVGHCIFGILQDKRLADFLERELSQLLPLLCNIHGFREGVVVWKNVQRAYGISKM